MAPQTRSRAAAAAAAPLPAAAPAATPPPPPAASKSGNGKQRRTTQAVASPLSSPNPDGPSPLWPLVAPEVSPLPHDFAKTCADLLLGCIDGCGGGGSISQLHASTSGDIRSSSSSSTASWQCIRQLRLISTSTRLLIDSRLQRLTLGAADLPALAAAATRLVSLRALTFNVREDACAVALAAALPSLSGLTSLVVRPPTRYDSFGGADGACVVVEGAVLVAKQLRALTNLRHVEWHVKVVQVPRCVQEFVPAVASLAELQVLILPHWRVSFGSGALRKALSTNAWPRLQEIHLSGLNIPDVNTLAAADLPHLTSLRLSDSSLFVSSDAPVMAQATWLSRLRRLALHSCCWSGGSALADASVGAMLKAQLDCLEELQLSCNSLGDAAACALAAAALPSLKRLSLGGNLNVTPHGVQVVATAPWATRLEALSVAGICMGTDGLVALSEAQLPSLRTLNLDATRPNAEGMTQLLAAPWLGGLTRLILSRCGKLMATGVAQMLAEAPLHSLRSLDLNLTMFEDGAAAVLGGAWWLQHLEEFVVSEWGVTAAGLKALNKQPVFKRLKREGKVTVDM